MQIVGDYLHEMSKPIFMQIVYGKKLQEMSKPKYMNLEK